MKEFEISSHWVTYVLLYLPLKPRHSRRPLYNGLVNTRLSHHSVWDVVVMSKHFIQRKNMLRDQLEPLHK